MIDFDLKGHKMEGGVDDLQIISFNKGRADDEFPFAWNYLTKSQFEFSDCEKFKLGDQQEWVIFEYCWWAGTWFLVNPHEPMWKRIIMRPLRDNEEFCEFEEEFESTVYGQNIAGYNGNSGIQILQVALQSLIRKGALLLKVALFSRDKGGQGDYRTTLEKKVLDNVNPLKAHYVMHFHPDCGHTSLQIQLIGTTDPESNSWGSKMRTAVKPETGGKARIFTIQEWDRTVALQPLGHFLIECLKSLPETNASLSRENTGWEWAQDMAKNFQLGSEPELLRRLFIMTNDLDCATDYGDFRVGKEMLIGFLEGIGQSLKGEAQRELSMYKHPYLRTATEILCSGVMMETVGAQAKKASSPPKKQKRRRR